MMLRYVRRLALLLALAPASTPGSLASQSDSMSGNDRPGLFLALPTIGDPTWDRSRLGYLSGDTATGGYLIRSPSARLPVPAEGRSGATEVAVLLPELLTQWNSAIPYSHNDGPLWAGRGVSTQAMFGAMVRTGRVVVVVAPQVAYSANADFALLPDSTARHSAGWSDFVAPWYLSGPSSDIPLRYGTGQYSLVDPGQSSVTLDLGGVAVGGATENQWWGPGMRNALVMSNHAAGVPHLFVRTTRPLLTPYADIEAKWIAGGLTESIFFDTIPSNDLRSLSAFVVTVRPVGEPNLTLGLSRAVYRSVSGPGAALANAADAFTAWDRRSAVDDDGWQPASQQILSLFGRWIFPESGLELYTEWARYELPVSVRDLLSTPNHTQGYTLGMSWAHANRYGTTRLQGESTFLEPSSTFRNRPWDSFYLSRTIPQGYTQRGQVIGAGVGPGSSSQWVALDHLGGRYEAGLYLNRIRWQAGELQRSVSENRYRTFRSFHAWDVSLIGGVRAGVHVGGMRIGAEAGLERRYNFLFQNPDAGYGPRGAVDVRNSQLRLIVTPSQRRRGASR